MKTIVVIILGLIVGVAAVPAQARVQKDFMCWVPDSEWPVDCEDEE